MSDADSPAFQSYRAPSENGTAFVFPPASLLSEAAHGNHARLSRLEVRCGSIDLDEIRGLARREFADHLARLARERTSAHSKPTSIVANDATTSSSDAISEDGLFLLSGHQPELFHPGVWFKNFLIAELAAKLGGVSANLQVDHDLCRSLALRVPVHLDNGTLSQELLSPEMYSTALPWEMRYARDRDAWTGFTELVHHHTASEQAILLDDMWPIVLQRIDAGDNVGQAYSIARNEIERRSGLGLNDLPMSGLAKGKAFAAFCFMLFENRHELAEVYNTCRQIYRRQHRIRNDAHPVPVLVAKGDWTEVPLWIYSTDNPARRGLYVRENGGRFELSDGQARIASLSASSHDAFHADWARIQSEGVCVRTRALTTTMFLRLFVADLFVHGIGGGKYDQLTDLIIRRWLGIVPPTFVVATATMRLPLMEADKVSSVQPAVGFATSTDWIRKKLRDSQYHVDRMPLRDLGLPGEHQEAMQQLVSRKSSLLDRIPEKGHRKSWHAEISQVNHELAMHANGYRQQLTSQFDQAQIAEREQSIRMSREYSIGLFPPSLPGQLQELARQLMFAP